MNDRMTNAVAGLVNRGLKLGMIDGFEALRLHELSPEEALSELRPVARRILPDALRSAVSNGLITQDEIDLHSPTAGGSISPLCQLIKERAAQRLGCAPSDFEGWPKEKLEIEEEKPLRERVRDRVDEEIVEFEEIHLPWWAY